MGTLIEQYREHLDLNIPFLENGYALFMGRCSCQDFSYDMRRIHEMIPEGLSHIDLQEIIRRNLDKDSIQYMMPGCSEIQFTKAVTDLIVSHFPKSFPRSSDGVLWKESDELVFVPYKPVESDLRFSITLKNPSFEDNMVMSSYSLADVPEPRECDSSVFSDMFCEEAIAIPTIRKAKSSSRKANRTTLPAIPDEIPELDEGRALSLENAFKAFMAENGVTLEELHNLIDKYQSAAPSPVCIDRRNRILLPGYDIEIKMGGLSKAVWLLYLAHPEGIRQKEMIDYRGELLQIYKSLTTKDDMMSISQSIDRLVDPDDNSLNEKISRANRAFTEAIHENVAKVYCIQGSAGEKRTISLSRDLVENNSYIKINL